MPRIDVNQVVKFHFVVPDIPGEMFNAHTHGLESFGHKEFQVLTPGYCRSSAASILTNHADAVINRGETFQAGDTGEIDGLICVYVEVPGDFLGDNTRLRIIDADPALQERAQSRCAYN
jgi:hypothetical protein